MSIPELENQLCQFTTHGYAGEGSPDRAEALIWAFTELFPRLTPAARAVPEKDGFYGHGRPYFVPGPQAWMS